jgi:hypothetical protein
MEVGKKLFVLELPSILFTWIFMSNHNIPPRRMLQLRPNFGHEGLFYRPLRNVHQIFRKRMVDVFELILISAATGCGSSKYVVGHDR